MERVVVKKLNRIMDERGYLQEIMRNDDDQFTEFGQIYITTTNPGVIKGWHYHKEQVDNVCCIKGNIKLVLWDGKEIKEIFLGEDNPKLVTIPKGIYHGWKGISKDPSFILNMPDKAYDYKNPDEVRVNPHNNDIPYDWKSNRDIDG